MRLIKWPTIGGHDYFIVNHGKVVEYVYGDFRRARASLYRARLKARAYRH